MTLTFDKVQSQRSANEKLVIGVLQELVRCGVEDICICSGKRDAPFFTALDQLPRFKQYFWPEERSAAFFALGRSKQTRRPTAVITTSGTAAGELLPAAMEAYYTGVPLVLITTDRPRSYRGTNAPQTAEQVGLFGQYAVFEQDIAEDEECSLKDWKRNGAAHINVCLDEPLGKNFECITELDSQDAAYPLNRDESFESVQTGLDEFLQKSRYPFVVVSAIDQEARDAVARFLITYQAPVYLEGVSGLREDPRLSHLRIARTDQIWKAAEEAEYPIDGVLRIGGVPTFRLWRDLDDLQGKMHVCSINSLPFSGLHWGSIHHAPLNLFFKQCKLKNPVNEDCHRWIEADRNYSKKLLELLQQEPLSEAALVYELSKQIPSHSLVYLGNSLPIREWDAYAASDIVHSNVYANRGLSGIDGQTSTFFGMCTHDSPNWGMIGDLTAIYDLAAPWILDQMQKIDLNLVIINNGGGKFFARLLPLKQIQNPHQVRFKSLAELWNMRYEYYTQLPEKIPYGSHRLIEIRPDEESTFRFWDRIGKI